MALRVLFCFLVGLNFSSFSCSCSRIKVQMWRQSSQRLKPYRSRKSFFVTLQMSQGPTFVPSQAVSIGGASTVFLFSVIIEKSLGGLVVVFWVGNFGSRCIRVGRRRIFGAFCTMRCFLFCGYIGCVLFGNLMPTAFLSLAFFGRQTVSICHSMWYI